MNYNELTLSAKARAIEDYLKDCIIEDQNIDETDRILSTAPQYDYNEDGTLNKVI